jgi:FdhD protein
MKCVKERYIVRITPQDRRREEDLVVLEIPFAIFVNGIKLITLLCTPKKLEYLSAGYLLAEGLLTIQSQIKNMTLDEENCCVNIDLEGPLPLDEFLSERVKPSAGGYISPYKRVEGLSNTSFEVDRGKLFELMEKFQQESPIFRDTGGVHSCALCNAKEIEVISEDVGRHNAIDKVLGECFLRGISTEDKIILTSGRIASEMLMKVAQQRVPIIASVSAPTDLAIELAGKLNITLVGFLREKRMNVYANEYRIT